MSPEERARRRVEGQRRKRLKKAIKRAVKQQKFYQRLEAKREAERVPKPVLPSKPMPFFGQFSPPTPDD